MSSDNSAVSFTQSVSKSTPPSREEALSYAHRYDGESVVAALESHSENGLSASEAKSRHQQYGSNEHPNQPGGQRHDPRANHCYGRIAGHPVMD